jgi:hypothetical protein
MITEYHEIQLEIPLNYGLETYGTCDRLTINGKKGLLADYKTGVSQIDHPSENWQAKAYTIGVFEKFPDLESVTFVFYIPFYNATPSHTFYRSDLEPLREQVSVVIARAAYVRTKWACGTPSLDELNPSQNCRFCAYESNCPALGSLVLGVADKLGVSLPDSLDPEGADPTTLENVYGIAKVVSNWADTYRSKVVVMAKEGLEFPTLRLRSMGQTKRCSDNEKLVEVAVDYGLTESELLSNASFPLGKISKAISDKAPKGEKSAKQKEFLDDLHSRGIIETSEERFTLS